MDKKPNKLKRILVATDFSEHSEFAILRAAELAKTTHSQLIILHISKKIFLEKMVGTVFPVVGKLLITPEEYATSFLHKQIEKLSRKKINVKYQIMSGDHSAIKILPYANEHKVDLLVMGAHGKYSVHDWFVGTTAEYVARKTQIPVLIIKKSGHKPYKNILVPLDFSKASKQALQFAGQLFPKANFRLLHVGDHDYEELLKNKDELLAKKVKMLRNGVVLILQEKLKKFIQACNPKLIKARCDIKLGYPGTVIIEEAKKQKQDLVVMGTEGHSQRHYLFIGRTASRVLIEIDKDLLLVPPQKIGRQNKKGYEMDLSELLMHLNTKTIKQRN